MNITIPIFIVLSTLLFVFSFAAYNISSNIKYSNKCTRYKSEPVLVCKDNEKEVFVYNECSKMIKDGLIDSKPLFMDFDTDNADRVFVNGFFEIYFQKGLNDINSYKLAGFFKQIAKRIAKKYRNETLIQNARTMFNELLMINVYGEEESLSLIHGKNHYYHNMHFCNAVKNDMFVYPVIIFKLNNCKPNFILAASQISQEEIQESKKENAIPPRRFQKTLTTIFEGNQVPFVNLDFEYKINVDEETKEINYKDGVAEYDSYEEVLVYSDLCTDLPYNETNIKFFKNLNHYFY